MPKYIVTNGIKYLRQNQKGDYYLVGKKEATAWGTQKQAQNALNNGIPKSKRSSFHVEKPDKSSDTNTILDNLLEADTSDYYFWLSSIGDFKKFVTNIEKVKVSLRVKQLNVDNEICDILHYVEFNRLNASQGWAAAEMIKNARLQRRKIKDALYIIDEIQRGIKHGISENKSAQTAIFKLNTRTYTPRKLDFLFNGDALYFHCGSQPQQV